MAKIKVRVDGEGTIIKLPDGRFRGIISLGCAGGKRRRKCFEAKTRKEVERKKAEYLRLHQSGVNVAPEQRTLAEFLRVWLDEVVARRVKPKTERTYRDIVQLHLIPHLGHHSLQRLRPEHVQEFMNKCSDKHCPRTGRNLSAKTVKHFRDTLRAALNIAKKWGYLAINPAEQVEPPRSERRNLHVFSPEEGRRFLEVIEGDRFEAIFVLALTLGLRKGELLALSWKDIDREAQLVTVRHGLQSNGTTKTRGETKTGRVHTIALPQIAAEALAAHQQRQQLERQVHLARWINLEWDPVFTSRRGTPIDPRHLSRQFERIMLKMYGHDEWARRRRCRNAMRIHDLRHSAATILLAKGVPPRVVQELLGHSDISVTMGTYSHVLPFMQRDAAAQMEEALGWPSRAMKPPNTLEDAQ